jgi:RimJ/RimL family protein N-acetyltransferase
VDLTNRNKDTGPLDASADSHSRVGDAADYSRAAAPASAYFSSLEALKCNGVRMELTVREMTIDEVELIIGYFHNSTAEHLEMLGVDPTRLASPEAWRDRYRREFTLPINQRATLLIIWLADDQTIGFSTSDKIIFGVRANMHLHIVDLENRQRSIGAECVKKSVDIYFERLKLKSLFCEPNAFNIAPNRTLQKAGFKYIKTHMTVPGALNYHQAVTRWMIER